MQMDEKKGIIHPLNHRTELCAHIASCFRFSKVHEACVLTLVLMVMILFVGVLSANATNWYVNKNATGAGNGTNWRDAWEEMDQINWNSISAGDTIWLAGGYYGTKLTVGKSGTSGSRIYIKRVRSTDSVPTSATGWNSTYDSQVVIDAWQGIGWPDSSGSTGSYVTIDGRIDSGIKTITGGSSWNDCGVWINNGATGVVLQYIEMAGPAGSDWYTHPGDNTGLQVRNAYGTPSDLTVRYCRIHGFVTGARILGLNGGVFEYNKIYDTLVANYETYHNNSAAVRECYGTLVWRYNEVYNGGAEGIMLGATASDVACRNEFYGNIFHSPPSGGASWRFVEAQYKNWQVIAYNNTIVDLPMGLRTANGGTFASGSEIRNNLFVNVSSPISVSGTYTATNNITNGSTSLFVNYSGDNYRLASPLSGGYTLASPYNTDMDGKQRGADGTWDVGAFEYGGSAPSPTVGITPPTGLRITSE